MTTTSLGSVTHPVRVTFGDAFLRQGFSPVGHAHQRFAHVRPGPAVANDALWAH
jgi:hypothetical protein